MNVAVVILNYNNWQDTLVCAESVLASAQTPRWVFIVDNASSNDSIRWFRHWAAGNLEFVLSELGAPGSTAKPLSLAEVVGSEPCLEPPQSQVILVRNLTNKGYAAGNNAGMALAMKWGADAVWLLNNDTLVDKNALGAMQKRLFSRRRPGLCGSLIRYMGSDGLVQCRGGGFTNKWTGLSVLDGNKEDITAALLEKPDAVEQRINFIYGASVMASREFVETVGLLDERYFLYCEEQDWAYSANGQFDFAYAPDALVRHKEGGTTGASYQKFNTRFLWHLTRSRLLLTWKHSPGALPTVCLGIMFAMLRMVWRRMSARLFTRQWES